MKKVFLLFMIITSLSIFTCKSQSLIKTFTEYNSITSQTLFGNSVKFAGDVNNDGYDDMLVGSSKYDSNRGCVYLFYGGAELENSSGLIFIGETVESNFGNSVSTAGDVNNDGYDDIIIAGNSESSGRGRVSIYYGGEIMNNVPDVVIKGEYSFGYLGCSVSSAGDVNGDGYGDVIIGEKGFYGGADFGRAMIFLGDTLMDNKADIVFYGYCSGDNFGSTVSSAGDVNGDDYGDVIIGMAGSQYRIGGTFIYYGGTEMDNKADVIIESELGYKCSISEAGDLNNDGFDDVIIGTYSSYADDKGRASIYFGNDFMDNTPDIILEGTITGSLFGCSVSGCGDLNNDGYSDVVSGANYSYTTGTGLAYVFYGGKEMDNNSDMILSGKKLLEGFGTSVSSFGDVNNDGYDDVLIGAPEHGMLAGAAYLFFGGSEKDSIADLILSGEPNGNGFGTDVSFAGDLNSDGFDEILIKSNYSNKGRVYLYQGTNDIDNQADLITDVSETREKINTISKAGDCNNDGFNDVIIGSSDKLSVYFGGNPINSVPEVIVPLNGEKQVSTAGDFNNDGYDDIVVGNVNYQIGHAFICYGGNPMDNTIDIDLTTVLFASCFGKSVASAGDVNNDGYNDVLVGANLELNEKNKGIACLFFGGNNPDNMHDLIITDNDATSDFGYSLSTAGDFNSDGYDDILTGDYQYNSKGRVYIYYGGAVMDSIPDLLFDGEAVNDYFGYSISDAGDLNNDNIDDIVIGAYNKNRAKGKIYIYFGGEQPDNIADIILEGEDELSYFGYSISSGDMNNDSYNELIVGSPERLNNGVSYLFDFHAPKKNQSIELRSITPVIYGTGSFAISGKATSELPIQYTSSNAEVASITWNTITVTGAGSTIIKASQPGNLEYAQAQEVSQELIVNKAILNVIAKDTCKTYGSLNPDFAIRYNGLVYYDKTEDLDVLPSVTTEATTDSPCGSYSLIPFGGSDNNYSFNYINGTLTIMPITGVNSPNKERIFIFPNPARNLLEINTEDENKNIIIYNSVGEVLIHKVTAENQIDVSALDSGLYFLKINDMVFKFIKE